MKLKCVVVDDEPLAMEMMAAYVRKTPYLQLEKVIVLLSLQTYFIMVAENLSEEDSTVK